MESFPEEYDALVNPTTLRAKALFGTTAQIQERLAGLAALGVTKVVFYQDPKDADSLQRFARQHIHPDPLQ